MIYPSKKSNLEVIAHCDELAEKLRNINPNEWLQERLGKVKKLYKRRKWDWKLKKYIPVYKSYPPKDPFKLRDYNDVQTKERNISQ